MRKDGDKKGHGGCVSVMIGRASTHEILNMTFFGIKYNSCRCRIKNLLLTYLNRHIKETANFFAGYEPIIFHTSTIPLNNIG